MKFTILTAPVTKKNHGQIIFNRKTGKRGFIPSKAYRNYLAQAREYIPESHIKKPVNVKAVFYMKTRRRVDLTNLCEALHDVMCECGCIDDDNCRIIVSMDGSRVDYDKENPRTEVEITEIENYVHPFDRK